MPIDPDVQKALDGLTALLAPEALAKALAPIVKAHTDAALKGVVTADGLQKQLDELATKLKPSDPDPADKGTKGKGEPDAAVAALQKQLDEQKAQLLAAERARVDAERKSVMDANRAKVRDALIAAGVDASAMHIVMPALETSGQLVLDGDAIGWKGKDNYGLDAVLPFEAGAKAWASSPDGKRFIPASNASGTGDNPNRNGTQARGGEVKSLNDLGSLLGTALLNF